MMANITDTFMDGTVLITGSTGFLGKILTEKLLRSCSLKNIAVLVRSKNGFTAEQRMADVYKQVVSILLKNIKNVKFRNLIHNAVKTLSSVYYYII